MGLIHMMAAVVGVFKALERECPKCHSKQIAAPSERDVPVVCRECGALIPRASTTESQLSRL